MTRRSEDAELRSDAPTQPNASLGVRALERPQGALPHARSAIHSREGVLDGRCAPEDAEFRSDAPTQPNASLRVRCGKVEESVEYF
jgi:hypothetical protein